MSESLEWGPNPGLARIFRYVLKVLVAGASVLFLFSFGGQAVAAPILVPLHIYWVRTGSVFGSVLWIVLASLLSLEAAYVYTLVFHAWWGTLVAIAAVAFGIGGPLLAAVTRRTP